MPHRWSAGAAPATARAVATTVPRLLAGWPAGICGSGRHGWLVDADAAELAPTFGFPAERSDRGPPPLGGGFGGAPDEDHPERGEETVAVAGLGAGWSRRAEARRSRAGRLAGRRPQGSDDRGRECARLRAGSHLRHPRRACGSATAAAAALGHALAREPGATSLRRCGRRDPLGPADVEWLRRSPAASICRREVAAPTAL